MRELLAAIEAYRQARGFSPTVRELAEAVGWSRGQACRALERLRASGEVAWVDGKQRTLRACAVRKETPPV